MRTRVGSGPDCLAGLQKPADTEKEEPQQPSHRRHREERCDGVRTPPPVRYSSIKKKWFGNPKICILDPRTPKLVQSRLMTF